MHKIKDLISVLPEKESNVATSLYKMGVELNCKIVFKKRTLKNKTEVCRIIFNSKNNKKILFWMEISNDTLLVKANLPFHIDDDCADKIVARSSKIKDSITTGKQCTQCSAGCGGPHLSYYVDKKIYMPCVTSGHYFSDMEEEDWNLIQEILVKKNDIK